MDKKRAEQQGPGLKGRWNAGLDAGDLFINDQLAGTITEKTLFDRIIRALNGVKLSAAVLALLLSATTARAGGDYYPGSWGENPIPRNILTVDDYHRYENVRKSAGGWAIVAGVGAFALARYAHDMGRKADRVKVTEPYLVMTPSGYSRYPVRQSSLDYKRRMVSKSQAAKKAAVLASAASLFLTVVRISVTF